MASAADRQRVFVRDGLRSYRRTYRVAEVKWGLATGAVLAAVVAWVFWRGAHPDPALFDMSAALSATAAEPASELSRGVLPPGLEAGGFREGRVGEYGADNLYVKINGRAGFFQSFGVRSLTAVALEGKSAEGHEPASIEIEVYDMGAAKNAIGAYNGERAPGLRSEVGLGFTQHIDRNAAFLARGPYYLRLIGSDESAAVRAELERLLAVFKERLPAGELPWAFSLFVDQLGLSAADVTYVKNNAFSFAFARDVYSARLSPADSAEDMEAFVVAAADEAGARSLMEQYRAGFESMGKRGGKTPSGVPLAEDEVLKSFSGALASERWVVGVRGAPSAARAHEVLERLVQGMAALPAAVRERAVPAPEEEKAPAEGTGTVEEGSNEY
jgi:hypothetical protein